MRSIHQLRFSAIARCTAALALCSLTLTTLAQSAPVPLPNITQPSESNAKHSALAAEGAYLAGARLLEHNDLTGPSCSSVKLFLSTLLTTTTLWLSASPTSATSPNSFNSLEKHAPWAKGKSRDAPRRSTPPRPREWYRRPQSRQRRTPEDLSPRDRALDSRCTNHRRPSHTPAQPRPQKLPPSLRRTGCYPSGSFWLRNSPCLR